MRYRRGLAALRVAALSAGVCAFLALLAAPAHALTAPLSFEFDDGIEGDYGFVRISEVTSGGSTGLFFELHTGPDLGPDPDLHYFYFNLFSAVDGLTIESDDDVLTPYSVSNARSVRGGAGSSFDYQVFFGNGGGPPGNGRLETATFTLFADSDLTTADLFEMSQTSGGLETFFAVHIQNTGLMGGGSETVGSNTVVPEPTTFALLSLGLIGLGVAGRKPRPD